MRSDHSPSIGIVLASASPRRRAFLTALGLDFTVLTADLDETPAAGEGPAALARRLAVEKAAAVAARLPGDGRRRLVVAADTVVALGDLILGKPADAAEAAAMLAALRDRTHSVHSGVCVLDAPAGSYAARVNSTDVTMRAYSDAEMAEYIAGGDPLDKAGAYAVQHPTFAPVASLDGCLAGVMGLPLADLRDLLERAGVHIAAPLPRICETHAVFSCCQRGKTRAAGVHSQ